MIKTVINHRFRLENSFQKILYLIDVWINERSGWIVQKHIISNATAPLLLLENPDLIKHSLATLMQLM